MEALLGIHKALRYMFSSPERGYAWIRKPNAAFGGHSALDRMLQAAPTNLAAVRAYLDAERGASFLAYGLREGGYRVRPAATIDEVAAIADAETIDALVVNVAIGGTFAALALVFGPALYQLLGGHGFIKEHPVERWYRDLRAVGVMEGALLV